jgi:glycosyl transferase family 25
VKNPTIQHLREELPVNEVTGVNGAVSAPPQQSTPRYFLDYFDRAFVVNLPTRLDRRREMEAELVRVGWNGRENLEFFPACRFNEADGWPSLGARGCFMSHLSILKRAQRERMSSVLIMEDDLTISPLFRELEADIVARLAQDDWGIAYIGHSDPIVPDPTPPMTVFTGELYMAHFYGVRGEHIGRLVEFLEQILTRPPGDPRGGLMHVDGAIHTYRTQNPDAVTLVAVPNLGSQRSSRSDITQGWYDKLPLLRGAAGAYRKAKRLIRS